MLQVLILIAFAVGTAFSFLAVRWWKLGKIPIHHNIIIATCGLFACVLAIIDLYAQFSAVSILASMLMGAQVICGVGMLFCASMALHCAFKAKKANAKLSHL